MPAFFVVNVCCRDVVVISAYWNLLSFPGAVPGIEIANGAGVEIKSF